MNSALREAANQARQKPVNLTHNQEVRSLSVGTGLPIPLQWVTRRNLCLMGDGARQCLMFFSFQMALACKLRHPHKEGLAFVLVYIYAVSLIFSPMLLCPLSSFYATCVTFQ